MRIIGNDQKNNGQNSVWEILDRIIGKISSIIGAGLLFATEGTQQFTGYFPNYEWLCHPWPPFCMISYTQNVVKGDKANHGWKTPCRLLRAFEVKVCDKWLASYKFLGPS